MASIASRTAFRFSRPYRRRPTAEQFQVLLTLMITWLLKMLTRQGGLIEEDTGIPYLTNLDGNPALAPLHLATCTYRIALGP